MAKYLDDNGLLYFWQKIKAKFATQTDLDTLSGRVDAIISTGGEPNVIETVKVNGTALTPDSNKAVDVTVPTNNNQLTNGAGYQTASDVSAAITGSGYQANVIESIKVNGTAQTITQKAVDISVPTNNNQLTNGAGYQTSADVSSAISTAIGALDSSISAETNKAIASVTITDGKITASTKVTIPTNNNQLTNGAGYQTASQVTSAINTALADITGISFEVVTSLPSTGAAGTIYLISNSGTGTNIYDEYIYVNSKWEKIGTTDVDLSSYYNTSNLTAITNAEIGTIVAA